MAFSNFFTRLFVFTLFFSMVAQVSNAEQKRVYNDDEPWKGTPYTEHFSVGISGGLGALGGTTGGLVSGFAAKKILHEGFLSEINDQVWLELQLGSYFASGVSEIFYSVHLRWDLHKDYHWTLFALGGFGGVTGVSGFGNVFHPRLGLGAMWHLFEKFSFRFDFSREFIGGGISFLF